MSDSQVNGLSIKANMLWNSVGSLTNLGCQWLITVLVARMAPNYESAGVYALAMSIFNMFTQFAQYRMYTVQIADINKERSVGEYLSFRLLTCGLALFVLVVYSVCTCKPTALPVIVLYALYKMIGLVIDVLHACDQCNHRMDYIGKSLILQGVFSLGGFMLVFGFTGILELAIACMALSAALIGILYDFPKAKQLDIITLKFNVEDSIRQLIQYAPIVVAGIAFAAAPNLPRQYISSSLGDSSLGVYASIAAPVAIIQMGATYIYDPLLGYLVERFFKYQKREFITLIVWVVLGIATVGIVCYAVLEFIGPRLLEIIYGPSICDYIYLLQPMIVCAFTTGLSWFLNDLLVALRMHQGVIIGGVSCWGLTLCIIKPLIDLFGINGATLVNLLTSIFSISIMATMLTVSAARWFSKELND